MGTPSTGVARRARCSATRSAKQPLHSIEPGAAIQFASTVMSPGAARHRLQTPGDA